MMQRYAASVQYQGTRYYGWQIQGHLPTIAKALNQAISRVAHHAVAVCCAGRTDKGVHAVSQIIHFDSGSKRSLHAWRSGINRYLPDDIGMDWIVPVDAGFHARFSAVARRYVYVICCAPVRPALLHQQVFWTHHHLDAASMHQAAQVLQGEHDFTSFRARECQSTTARRNIHHISVYRNAVQQYSQQLSQQQWLVVDVIANAFLHHMVRTIVGSLLEIGRNRKPMEWLAQVLAARDRAQAGENAPPHGLYLKAVRYADVYALPGQTGFSHSENTVHMCV